MALLTRDGLNTRSAFTISEAAADKRAVVIPQRTMRPSIARINEQLDPWFAPSTLYKLIVRLISHTTLCVHVTISEKICTIFERWKITAY